MSTSTSTRPSKPRAIKKSRNLLLRLILSSRILASSAMITSRTRSITCRLECLGSIAWTASPAPTNSCRLYASTSSKNSYMRITSFPSTTPTQGSRNCSSARTRRFPLSSLTFATYGKRRPISRAWYTLEVEPQTARRTNFWTVSRIPSSPCSDCTIRSLSMRSSRNHWTSYYIISITAWTPCSRTNRISSLTSASSPGTSTPPTRTNSKNLKGSSSDAMRATSSSSGFRRWSSWVPTTSWPTTSRRAAHRWSGARPSKNC